MRTTKTDQTGRMPRLIWVFAGRTSILLVCHESAHLYVRELYNSFSGCLSECHLLPVAGDKSLYNNTLANNLIMPCPVGTIFTNCGCDRDPNYLVDTSGTAYRSPSVNLTLFHRMNVEISIYGIYIVAAHNALMCSVKCHQNIQYFIYFLLNKSYSNDFWIIISCLSCVSG